MQLGVLNTFHVKTLFIVIHSLIWTLIIFSEKMCQNRIEWRQSIIAVTTSKHNQCLLYSEEPHSNTSMWFCIFIKCQTTFYYWTEFFHKVLLLQLVFGYISDEDSDRYFCKTENYLHTIMCIIHSSIWPYFYSSHTNIPLPRTLIKTIWKY